MAIVKFTTKGQDGADVVVEKELDQLTDAELDLAPDDAIEAALRDAQKPDVLGSPPYSVFQRTRGALKEARAEKAAAEERARAAEEARTSLTAELEEARRTGTPPPPAPAPAPAPNPLGPTPEQNKIFMAKFFENPIEVLLNIVNGIQGPALGGLEQRVNIQMDHSQDVVLRKMFPDKNKFQAEIQRVIKEKNLGALNPTDQYTAALGFLKADKFGETLQAVMADPTKAGELLLQFVPTVAKPATKGAEPPPADNSATPTASDLRNAKKFGVTIDVWMTAKAAQGKANDLKEGD